MAEETTATTTTATEGTSTSTTTVDNTTTQAEQTTKEDSKKTDWEAVIQKAVDRATNKLGNENKKLREEMDKLKKEKLSDEELRDLEMKEKEKEIAEREQRLLEKENRLLAIKAIKEIGLDDGSDTSLALVDFVMAEDEASIKEKVKTFNTLVERMVQAKVDKVFKASGRNPGKSSTGASETDTKKDSIAARLGQNTAQVNKTAQSTLEHYIGGKKK